MIMAFTVNAQTPLKVQKRANLTPNDIVITESTYNKFTNTNVNRKKLARQVDFKNSGKTLFADDPIRRVEFEQNMLIDPATGIIPKNIRSKELTFARSRQSGLKSFLKTGGVNFENVGPINVGGRTRALAIDLNDNNTIFAGGVSGGLWKSTDNGESWTRKTPITELQSITAIAQDPREGQRNTWYYTTGELIGNSARGGSAPFSGNGVYKSVDNGENWALLASTTTNTPQTYEGSFDYCWNVCINPINGDVYVATGSDIQRSQNGGSSWQIVLNSGASYNDIICTPQGVLYAALGGGGTINGVFRSESGNENDWQNITPSDLPDDTRRMIITYAPSNTSILYLLAFTPEAGYSDHSFFKLNYESSSNFNWSNRSSKLPITTGDVAGYNSQRSYNMLIKVAPDDENMVFIGGTNLYRSDDAFATRNNIYWVGGYATSNNIHQYENHHPDVHALAFKTGTESLICGHDGGLSITTNFKQTEDSDPSDEVEEPIDWEFLNNGYLTTQAYTVALDPDVSANKTVISGFQDNGTWLSSDGSYTNQWQAINSGDGSYCAITDNGNGLITSSQNGTVYIDYIDGGFARLDPDGATDQLFVNPFIIDANSSEIMYYVDGQYIWRNTNIFGITKGRNSKATQNWEKLDISLANADITALESSTFPSHILYYGTRRGKIYKLEKSHSPFATKTDITGSNMPSEAYVSSISTNPQNADEVLVCFSNYNVESVFYSSDGGTTWAAVSGELEENGNTQGSGPSIRTVLIAPTPTGITYYAGASTGLYSTNSLNGSDTNWSQISDQTIGNAVVAMLKRRGDGYTLAATHANGIYALDDDYSSSTPVALIGLCQDTILIGEMANFKSRSLGDITTYSWAFSGAETTSSSVANPEEIIYNSPGTYTVSLTVSNLAGTNTQTIESAIVVKTVKTEFTANKTTAFIGEAIDFTDGSSGTPSAWEWTFEGGTTDDNTVQNPSVTYAQAGVYSVSLRVTDANNFTDTRTKNAYITILDPNDREDDLLYNVLDQDEDKLGTYGFSADGNWGYTAGHNNFQMNQFAEKFTIENPNLNVVKSIQIAPIKLSSKSSSPKILLKVWNGTDEPTTEVHSEEIAFSDIVNGQFNEFIFADPIQVGSEFFAGIEIFYETPVDTFAVSHLPLSGDITWGNTAYAKFNGNWQAFSSSSLYEANSALAIKANVGYVDPSTLGIQADFTADQTTVEVENTVSFTDQSTGEVSSWLWNFPGGATSDNSIQNPVVTYNNTGTYSVSLTASNGNLSNTETKQSYITVSIPTGIDDLNKNNKKVLIYPNPLVNQSTIKFPRSNQSVRLIVVDASGRVVRIIENVTGDNVLLNREQLKPGIHIINIEGKKIYKGKLLVK